MKIKIPRFELSGDVKIESARPHIHRSSQQQQRLRFRDSCGYHRDTLNKLTDWRVVGPSNLRMRYPLFEGVPLDTTAQRACFVWRIQLRPGTIQDTDIVCANWSRELRCPNYIVQTIVRGGRYEHPNKTSSYKLPRYALMKKKIYWAVLYQLLLLKREGNTQYSGFFFSTFHTRVTIWNQLLFYIFWSKVSPFTHPIYRNQCWADTFQMHVKKKVFKCSFFL